jgi:hypothetical protein
MYGTCSTAACSNGWQPGQTEYTANLVTILGCSTAVYYATGGDIPASGFYEAGYVRVSKDCSGAITAVPMGATGSDFQNRQWVAGYVPISNWLQTGQSLAEYSGIPSARGFTIFPLESIQQIGSPPAPLTYSLNAPSNAEASDSSVTVTTNGIGEAFTQSVTIGKNNKRFSRVVVVRSDFRFRNTVIGYVNDSNLGGVGFTYPTSAVANSPVAIVTQKGYGGEADDKCIADPIWINASGIFMPNQLALNRGDLPTVYADFTKERCLVCQPTTLEGSACEWTATGSAAWMKITKKDGLFTLTIDPDVEYTLGPVCSYTSGLTGTVTVGTQKESETWTVCIKME